MEIALLVLCFSSVVIKLTGWTLYYDLSFFGLSERGVNPSFSSYWLQFCFVKLGSSHEDRTEIEGGTQKNIHKKNKGTQCKRILWADQKNACCTFYAALKMKTVFRGKNISVLPSSSYRILKEYPRKVSYI